MQNSYEGDCFFVNSDRTAISSLKLLTCCKEIIILFVINNVLVRCFVNKTKKIHTREIKLIEINVSYFTQCVAS